MNIGQTSADKFRQEMSLKVHLLKSSYGKGIGKVEILLGAEEGWKRDEFCALCEVLEFLRMESNLTEDQLAGLAGSTEHGHSLLAREFNGGTLKSDVHEIENDRKGKPEEDFLRSRITKAKNSLDSKNVQVGIILTRMERTLDKIGKVRELQSDFRGFLNEEFPGLGFGQDGKLERIINEEPHASAVTAKIEQVVGSVREMREETAREDVEVLTILEPDLYRGKATIKMYEEQRLKEINNGWPFGKFGEIKEEERLLDKIGVKLEKWATQIKSTVKGYLSDVVLENQLSSGKMDEGTFHKELEEKHEKLAEVYGATLQGFSRAYDTVLEADKMSLRGQDPDGGQIDLIRGEIKHPEEKKLFEALLDAWKYSKDVLSGSRNFRDENGNAKERILNQNLGVLFKIDIEPQKETTDGGAYYVEASSTKIEGLGTFGTGAGGADGMTAGGRDGA